jgi:hypothetical protein
MAAREGSGQGLRAWRLGKQVLRQESLADKVRCTAALWHHLLLTATYRPSNGEAMIEGQRLFHALQASKSGRRP